MLKSESVNFELFLSVEYYPSRIQGSSEPLIIKRPLRFYVLIKGYIVPRLIRFIELERKRFLLFSDRIFHLSFEDVLNLQ